MLFVLALLQELWKAALIPDDDAESMAEIAKILNIPALANVQSPSYHPWIEQVFRGLGWYPAPAADVSSQISHATTE